MTLLVDLCKSATCDNLRLPISKWIVMLIFLSVISTNEGLNLYQLGSIMNNNSNNSLEIAVAIPSSIDSNSSNQCCSINDTSCHEYGSHCECVQDDTGCKCFCPTASIIQEGLEITLQDCCSVNITYCRRFGSQCGCQQDDSGCRCVCPSALDYTVRLAAAIAIILLIGVSIMLAISLYRRASQSRARSQLSASQNVSEVSQAPDPPPSYVDIYHISYPRLAPEADDGKLPTYSEALDLQKLQNGQNSDTVPSGDSKTNNETESSKVQEDIASGNGINPVVQISGESTATPLDSDSTTNPTVNSSKVVLPTDEVEEQTDL